MTVEPPKKRRGRPPKNLQKAQETIETKEKTMSSTLNEVEKEVKPKRTRKISKKAAEDTKKEKESPTSDLVRMYVMKFNAPILPFSKFPLSHNKYIQDFIKMYELDKDNVDKVIGVHFPKNNNEKAKNNIGIEIKISKQNNLTQIESNSS